MSAEAGLTERLAAVIREHQTVATGLGEWACRCSPMEWRHIQHRSTHVAAALAPLVAEEVAAAEVRALREAAVRYDETEAGPGDHAASWLRNRADRIATTDGGA